MSASAPTPNWPSDPDHRDAIDTLLVMAQSEHRWGNRQRATNLLDSVERIVGTLPRPYAHLRSGSRRAGSGRPVD